MKKKIAAIAAVCLFALTSCGTVRPKDDTTPTPELTTSPEDVEPFTEGATEAPASDDKPSADFPELSFTPEIPDVELTPADAALPDGYNGSYIVRKLSYYGDKLFGVSFSIMDSHDNVIYDNYYDLESGEMGIPTYTKREYDRFGKLTECESTYDGNVLYSYKYEYDENGYLIKYSYLSEGGEFYSIYTNDGYGNPVSISSHDYSDSVVTHKYSYDNNGNILTDTTEGGDPMLAGTISNEYDENGRIIKVASENAATSRTSYSEYVYDDNDNVIFEHVWLDDNGDYVDGGKVYKEYDSKNRVVRHYAQRGEEAAGEDMYMVYTYTDLG